jgi:hypothetical protein
MFSTPKRLLSINVGAIAVFLCSTVTVLPGAVGGPKSIEVKLSYHENNTKTVTIQFEGGKEAHVLVTGDVAGYSVAWGSDGKQFYGRMKPTGKPGEFGIQGTWRPDKTSNIYVQIINSDDDARKDATFHIETN